MQESNKNTPLTTAIGEGRLDDAANMVREAFGLCCDEFIVSEGLCRGFIADVDRAVKIGYLYNNLNAAVGALAEGLGYGSAVQALQDHINQLTGILPAKQKQPDDQDQVGYRG
jgi:hypothetical protein